MSAKVAEITSVNIAQIMSGKSKKLALMNSLLNLFKVALIDDFEWFSDEDYIKVWLDGVLDSNTLYWKYLDVADVMDLKEACIGVYNFIELVGTEIRFVEVREAVR